MTKRRAWRLAAVLASGGLVLLWRGRHRRAAAGGGGGGDGDDGLTGVREPRRPVPPTLTTAGVPG